MWEIAIALAKAILEDQEKREQAAADEQLARGIIDAVRQAIEESTARILDFLRQQHLVVLSPTAEQFAAVGVAETVDVIDINRAVGREVEIADDVP